MSREPEPKRRPTRGKAGLTVLAAGAVLAVWILCIRPWILVASAYSLSGSDTPEQERLACRVAACGPSGLSATLWAAEEGFGSDGRFAWTPLALRRIGEPARKELIARVRRTAEPARRHHLIRLLQLAFDDYRFLDDWIRDAPSESSMDGRSLQRELTRVCGQTPPPLGARGAQSAAFREYYGLCSDKLHLPAHDTR